MLRSGDTVVNSKDQSQFCEHVTYAIAQAQVLGRVPCLVECSVTVLKFFIIFKQEASNFHFSLGPATYVANHDKYNAISVLMELRV